MDPNGIVEDTWYDDRTIPGDTTGKSGKGKTYAHFVLYNDGREVWTYYRYGSNDVVSTSQFIDEAQKKIYDDAAKAAQTQADQSERRVVRTYTGTDPSTGKPATVTEYESGPPKYDEIKPSASATQPGQVQGVPNNPTIQEQQADGSWVTKPNPSYVPPAGASGSIMERPDGVYIVKPDGTTVKTDLPAKPAAGSSSTVKGGDGKTYIVTVDAQGNVTTQDSGVPAEPKSPTIKDIDGVPHELVQTPEGPVYKPVKIEGQGGAVPDIGELKLQFGQVAEGLHQRHRQYQDAVRAGTMTVAQADKAWQRDLELGQVKVDEINSLLETQRGASTPRSPSAARP